MNYFINYSYSLKYIKSAQGKFVSLDRLKAKRSELISKQKKLRTRYYTAKNAEKELYSIKLYLLFPSFQ